MQIAHNLCQIVEKSNLIGKTKINYFWSNYDIWIELFIELRSEIINLNEIDNWQGVYRNRDKLNIKGCVRSCQNETEKEIFVA